MHGGFLGVVGGGMLRMEAGLSEKGRAVVVAVMGSRIEIERTKDLRLGEDQEEDTRDEAGGW